MVYLPRNYIKVAERYLKTFPVLCLIGPRQAGKTNFAKHLCPDWDYFDLEKQADFELIARSPDLFFEQYKGNIILDEAQELPLLFKTLRGVIDANREIKGRFILTGSSSPELISHLSDTLAGRIGIVQIDTLKANEFYQTPLSTFYDLFAETYTKESINLAEPLLSNEQMRHCWLYGGYPEPMLMNDKTMYQDWMDNYFSTYINRDIARLFPRLNKLAYQRFISTLSSLSGTIINKADLARAIEIGEKTITEYLQIAEQTFIWRNIGYDVKSTVKSLVKRSKGYVTDSGLQHYLQKIQDFDSLLRSANVGHSFETFVIEEIIKGITAAGINNVDYSYYRTAKGAEVDLIVSTPTNTIPIEIKMAKSVRIKELSSLTKYIADNQLPFGLLINQSDRVFWVTENILQVPVGIL
jgi:predicted AAA+ superfamily ATPase